MTSSTQKWVYVDMVGDLFHLGHVNMLKNAKELANQKGLLLCAGVHSDADVLTYKRTPVLTVEERVAVISSCRYVDRVIPNAPLVPTSEFMNKENIALIVHGDDFDTPTVQKYYCDAIKEGKFQSFPYTQGISTSQIIQRIKTRVKDGTL